jgi:hypothetical protein
MQQVKVFQVAITGRGYNVVHAQVGNVFGTLVAAEDVLSPGVYRLQSRLIVQEGKIVPLIKVVR